MTPKDFIARILPAAKADKSIPASITIAQAALESGWGTSGLTVHANNLFGIKAYNWNGPTLSMQGSEYVNGQLVPQEIKWRSYPDWASSIADHAKFLRENGRYSHLFEGNLTAQQFADGLQKAGYSTNPKYAQLLMQIVDENQMEQYDTTLAAADPAVQPVPNKVQPTVQPGKISPGWVRAGTATASTALWLLCVYLKHRWPDSAPDMDKIIQWSQSSLGASALWHALAYRSTDER